MVRRPPISNLTDTLFPYTTLFRSSGTVLCGPSGSGKATLLRCLNGLEEWEEGEVSIGGTPVAHRARDLRRLRREVGMVFQSFNLFPHLDALTNVTLAPRAVGIGRASCRDRVGQYV